MIFAGLLENLGRTKFRIIRLIPYANALQMLMVGYLFIKDAGFHWWYFLVFAGFFVAYLFEKRYGLPQEQYLSLTSNPEWQRFLKEQK